LISRKMRIHLFLVFIVILIIVLPMLNKRPPEEKADEAKKAAAEFFTLIEAGEFEKSWERSASLLKTKVSKTEWTEKLAGIQKHAGKVENREQDKMIFERSAKDSPDGEYILITYKTKFEKGAVEETLTTMLDKDQTWRVAGYFLK